MGRKGLPDLVVLLPYIILGIELKKQGGRPEDSQLEVQKAWLKLGHCYCILTHSENWKGELSNMLLEHAKMLVLS